MSAKPSSFFQFDGYTVRPMTEQDRPYLGMQIQADEYHRDQMTADYFLKLLPGESSWALEDQQGRVVFYFKNSPAVRMSIQFTAEADLAGKRGNMTALIKGLAWIEAIFRGSYFREIIFDTEGPELKLFAKRHLGFVDAPNLLSHIIAPYRSQESQLRTVGTVPTGGLEVGE
jgi:hypothetical protein